jgi:hypothetical protein
LSGRQRLPQKGVMHCKYGLFSVQGGAKFIDTHAREVVEKL